jgi:hypothetical protein
LLRRIGAGTHQAATDVVHDPAVVIRPHPPTVGFQHCERIPREFSGGLPGIDATHLQGTVKSLDMFLQPERPMAEGARRFGDRVTQQDGAVKDGDSGLRFRHQMARQVDPA